MRYISSPDFHRDGAERIGILLVNSGTPASPAPKDVRKFLAGRWVSARGGVAASAVVTHSVRTHSPFPTAPFCSQYRKIWARAGSPLLTLSEQLRSN